MLIADSNGVMVSIEGYIKDAIKSTLKDSGRLEIEIDTESVAGGLGCDEQLEQVKVTVHLYIDDELIMSGYGNS